MAKTTRTVAVVSAVPGSIGVPESARWAKASYTSGPTLSGLSLRDRILPSETPAARVSAVAFSRAFATGEGNGAHAGGRRLAWQDPISEREPGERRPARVRSLCPARRLRNADRAGHRRDHGDGTSCLRHFLATPTARTGVVPALADFTTSRSPARSSRHCGRGRRVERLPIAGQLHVEHGSRRQP